MTSSSAAPASAVPLVVGVISDTHGHLYPQVAERLRGVDHIIHAGDVGSPEVLKALRLIAPVVAVRGNVDAGAWADALPSRAQVELGGVCVVVGHVSPRLDGAGRPGQPVVVVAGHSHVATVEQRGDILYLNPGSAGPRRFGRPRTLVRLEIWPLRPTGEARGDASGASGAAGGGIPAAPDTPGAGPLVTAQIISVDRH
jgi:uncharacterized protein